MLQNNIIEVMSLSTNSPLRTCPICDKNMYYGGDDLASNINHYLQTHQYRLLHVGQETTQDTDGNIYHHTVAILGQ